MPPNALTAVAQLDGLVLARRRARRYRGPAERAGFEAYVDLDGGVAATVEDLAGMDVRDRAHARRTVVPTGASAVRRRPPARGPRPRRGTGHLGELPAGAPKMRR